MEQDILTIAFKEWRAWQSADIEHTAHKVKRSIMRNAVNRACTTRVALMDGRVNTEPTAGKSGNRLSSYPIIGIYDATVDELDLEEDIACAVAGKELILASFRRSTGPKYVRDIVRAESSSLPMASAAG